MSDIDLTEAVQAGTAVLDTLPSWTLSDHERAQEILTAALPHIEQQIRAAIAAEIRAEADRVVNAPYASHQEIALADGLYAAALIARGTTQTGARP